MLFLCIPTKLIISMFRPTIGLEIHAELATPTKMFCMCQNNPHAQDPNTNVCPVCLAHPGSLPTVNKEAIHKVLRVGTALGSTLADFTEFDRKSYFYPDIPKGYQISQFEYPLVSGGVLCGIPVTRIHLEEDTARSSHVGEGDTSLVDFNRAGVPLMELVTEPDIHDSKTAGEFARELQLLLRTLGVSEANLEKGEMRIEANISVSNTSTLGTKVEVKNLNSFRSVERAIEYEITRQVGLIESGGSVEQETRGWDENKQVTFRQRSKEGSSDYRFFPEPDIPKIMRSEVPEWSEDNLLASLPELPKQRKLRYENLGIKKDDALFITAEYERGVFFDEVIAKSNNNTALVLLACNYFVSDLAGLLAKEHDTRFEKISPTVFVKLISMAQTNTLSSRGVKNVLALLIAQGGEPSAIAQREGLIQVNDTESLRSAVKNVLRENPSEVAQFKNGKISMLQYFVGQGMKATKGAGNPELLKELFEEELSS